MQSFVEGNNCFCVLQIGDLKDHYHFFHSRTIKRSTLSSRGRHSFISMEPKVRLLAFLSHSGFRGYRSGLDSNIIHSSPKNPEKVKVQIPSQDSLGFSVDQVCSVVKEGTRSPSVHVYAPTRTPATMIEHVDLLLVNISSIMFFSWPPANVF